MLMLHRSLAGVGRLAAKEASRASILGVLVEDLKEKARVTATDGKCLIRVTTEKDESIHPPKARGFDPSANGSKEALVPAGIFTKVLSEIPISKNSVSNEFAAVTLEKEQVTFASNTRDDRMKRVTPVEPYTGEWYKFPDVQAVFPKQKPLFKLHMSPTLLAQLLMTISSVVGQRQGVTLEFYGKEDSESLDQKAPVTIKAKNYKGNVKVEAVIMPLTQNEASMGTGHNS